MRARINERCLINTHEWEAMNRPADPQHSCQGGRSARMCAWEIIEQYSRNIVCSCPFSSLLQWCIGCALTQSTRAHYELAAMPHTSCCSWQLTTDNKWQLQLFVWFLINAFAQCLSNYAFGAMPPHNGYGKWQLATGNRQRQLATTTRGASSTAAASRSSCRMNNSNRGRSSHGN